MLVPRRAVLAALSIGTTASALPDVRRALGKVPADEQLLADLADSLRGLGSAGRVMAPAQLVDSLIGQVTVLDVVRHRAPAHLRRDYLMLAAEYAESLSWMVQESGDLHGAVSWVDRAQHWADWAPWPEMVAFAHMRRSNLASTCAGDGRAAIEHAARVLHLDAPPMVQTLAVKQIAYGSALLGRSDDCRRALDRSEDLHAGAARHQDGPDPVIGLTRTGSTIDDQVMLAQYRATCDVYLGGGDRAITALSAYREACGVDSRSRATIDARLARAYAQAGDPDHACALAQQALDTGQALDSATTRVELRRALGPLRRWPGREDVAEVRHRITTLA
jgi:hypothetical protein